MSKLIKRILFLHLNKYQKELLYPILISCFFGCLIALLVLDYFYFDQAALVCRFSFSHLKMLLVWFVPLVAFMLFIVGLQIYLLTSRILGPCNRMIREIDDVLGGKTKKHLKVRKKDEMFRDLAERINGLIDRIS